jgi:hypothetical protein
MLTTLSEQQTGNNKVSIHFCRVTWTISHGRTCDLSRPSLKLLDREDILAVHGRHVGATSCLIEHGGWKKSITLATGIGESIAHKELTPRSASASIEPARRQSNACSFILIKRVHGVLNKRLEVIKECFFFI